MTAAMTSRPGTNRGPIIIAGALLGVAATLFGAVFYLYDGVSVATELLSRITSSPVSVGKTEPASAAEVLRLPAGMSQEFALNVWQGQADSQRAIAPLAEGKVDRLEIEEVDIAGELAAVNGTLVFKDGVRAPGVIGLHRFDEVWYVAYVSTNRATTEAEQMQTPAPDLADVDVDLLNTIIAEQAKGKAISQDIVDGKIDVLSAGTVRKGPNTATIPLTMRVGDVRRPAELIAISSEYAGNAVWFLARFNETGAATQ